MADLSLCNQIKTADFKSEKHVPVIQCPDSVAADQVFDIKVTLGKEIAHPNTTAHHIQWIDLYFMPDGGKFTYQIAKVEFAAHGASAEGPDTSGIYTHHEATAMLKTAKGGTLTALAYCNIHGLWESSKKISVK